MFIDEGNLSTESKIMIGISDRMNELTNENMGSFLGWIEMTGIMDNSNYMKILVLKIVQYSYQRPRFIELSEDACSKLLLKYETKVNFARELRHHALKKCPVLVARLLKKGFFNFDSISESIYVEDRELFAKYYDPNLVTRFISDYDYKMLSSNDWKSYGFLLMYGTLPNSLEYIVKYDLIDQFQEIVSVPTFSWKNTISYNRFEPYKFYDMYNNFSIIDGAAVFGSVRIFRYCVENNQKISPLTSKFAIYSNCFEIVHLCEAKLRRFGTLAYYCLEHDQFHLFVWLQERLKSPLIAFKEAIEAHNHRAILYFVSNYGSQIEYTSVISYLNHIYHKYGNFASDISKIFVTLYPDAVNDIIIKELVTGSIVMAKEFFRCNKGLNDNCTFGKTFGDIAFESNKPESVKLLLDCDYDFSRVQDYHHESVCMLFYEEGSEIYFEKLLNRVIKGHRVYSENNTIWHSLCMKPLSSFIKYFDVIGSSINQCNDNDYFLIFPNLHFLLLLRIMLT